eukprot:6731247-Prymnesium_polylepis.1
MRRPAKARACRFDRPGELNTPEAEGSQRCWQLRLRCLRTGPSAGGAIAHARLCGVFEALKLQGD